MTTLDKGNHLVDESSPYLQQHAYNPVEWFPWGEAALAKAKKENKPILLSIGYAACHWCHVMAHESFEDDETADFMNRFFVNIKVDREERPDLDKIYQSAHYLLTQHAGGWPLTVFLTPDDLVPFFSGTYFPLTAQYQLPAFKDILQIVANFYQTHAGEIKQQNAKLSEILHQTSPVIKDVRLTAQPIQLALGLLQESYDYRYGGFTHAPKFPHSTIINFLTVNHSEMAANTLSHMAEGGIYDQLAGGFYRYAIDAKWEIPHFEKMLYDNAQLLLTYTYASVQFQENLFTDIAKQTAEWVMHKMQAPNGGYFSTMDADSEGHEGRYYVWDIETVETLLTPDEYKIIRRYYGLDQPANFNGKWHLHITKPIETVAQEANISTDQVILVLNTAKTKLLNARNEHIPPNRDEKILTAWNALMIKSMFIAGDWLSEPSFIISAEKALAFIYQNIWKNKRLFASYKDKQAHINAYLDDYAFLLDAVLTALQIKWNKNYLQFAIDLADSMLSHFSDQSSGGFFFTADDHEKLLYRPKIMMDEATPAGNGVAARALLTLGYLLGEQRYTQAAEKTLQAAWPTLSQFPAEQCTLLLALNEFLNPKQLIVIRGASDDIHRWRDTIKTNQQKEIFAIPDDEQTLPGALALRKPHKTTCAYICQGTQCSAPIESLRDLKLT